MADTRLFHRTSAEAAPKILAEGFLDSWGSFGLANTILEGVFLSNVPLDVNEGTADGPLLEVLLDMSQDDVDRFELIEDRKGYREFCVPAEIVNAKGRVRQMTLDEEDALYRSLMAKNRKTLIACLEAAGHLSPSRAEMLRVLKSREGQ